VLAGLLLLMVTSGLTALWFRSYTVSHGPGQWSGEKRIFIPPGSGLSKIQEILVKSDVIDNDIRFVILARFMGVARRLKAGEYEFSQQQSPLEVLNTLAQGKTALRSITITEGTNIFQAAARLEQQGWSQQQTFMELLRDKKFISSLGLSKDSLEGYLFPDTYLFPLGEDIRVITARMVDRTKDVVEEECRKVVDLGGKGSCRPDWLADSTKKADAPKDLLLSEEDLHAVLTLASIVEKETGMATERTLVAGVFTNRLNKGMKLQADPTVIYGLQKFDAPLSKRDLKSANPYNTYINRGLPPGPICNPGQAAISAVLNPAKERFYYFVAQGDGSHYFSKTLKEHNRAVARLRQFERANRATKAK